LDVLETKAEADLRRENRRGPAYAVDDGDEWPSSAGSGGFFDK
jgi:hypothetical protein